MSDEILEWGIRLILSVQGLGDWLTMPMNVLTFTGNDEFYLLVLPAIYWCWDRRLGLRVAIILLLSTSFNAIFKLALHDPRPYWTDSRVRLLTDAETSFGLPSGHAQNAVVIWGTLAAYLGTVWVWLAASVLIFFVGVSRVYLGVHYPTDVIAGWVIGLIGLFLFLSLEKPVMALFAPLGRAAKVGIVFAVSLGLILVGVLLSTNVNLNSELPAEWLENAKIYTPEASLNPLSLELLLTSAGAFFGLAAGAIFLERHINFEVDGPWHKRLGRYLIGAAGVFILWRGLDAIFALVAVDESLPGYLLRYIRYSLIGGWISAFGPLVFIRLRLAKDQRLPQISYET